MDKAVKIILGVLLVLGGLFWALVSLGVISPSFDFAGWWAFLIIIPCIGGLFTDKDKTGSLMGIGLGVLLFCAARDIISWDIMWKLGLAFIIIIIGMSLIFSKSFRPTKTEFSEINLNGRTINKIEASFGKQDLDMSGKNFEGAEVKVAFASSTIDLRGATLGSGDAVIVVDVAFGGLVIYVPEGMAVRESVKCGFGGVSDNRRVKNCEGTPAIILTGSVGFGGIELR